MLATVTYNIKEMYKKLNETAMGNKLWATPLLSKSLKGTQ